MTVGARHAQIELSLSDQTISEPFRVALLGFSAFERSALSSYFRLASHRQPRYEHVPDFNQAQFLIADADQSGVIDIVSSAGRTNDTVFVGAHGSPGATAWMMRPIDPLHVLRELDMLAARSGPSGMTIPLPLRAVGHLSVPAPVAPIWPPQRNRTARSDRRSSDVSATPPRTKPSAPVPVALLVDDSEIALRFLERQLEPFQMSVRRACSSGQALELLASQPFGFVFLDVELGQGSDLDGLTLCQHIKRKHVHPGGRTPVVVILSAHQKPVDQVRGALAGADAYLGKPLDNASLAEVLINHGVLRSATQAVAQPSPQPAPK